MDHDFSAYTVENLEHVMVYLDTERMYADGSMDEADKTEDILLYKERSALLTDLLAMLSKARIKSLAFRKGIEEKMDTLKIEVNYK